MAQDESYQTTVYHEQGGDKEVVTSNGAIEVQSAGAIDISTEGVLNIQSGGLLRGLSGGGLSAESSFNFFNVDENVTPAHMRNFFMGRFAWSIITNSNSATSDNVLSDMGGSSPPVLPSRTGYIVLSLGKASRWSARMCSAYKGQEVVIMIRDSLNTSGEIIFSAGNSTLNISGTGAVGLAGQALPSIELRQSGNSFGMIRLFGIDDGLWALVATGSHEGDCVVEM